MADYGFTGDRFFLSNFHEGHPFRLAGHDWATGEHAYQAFKTTDQFEQSEVRHAPTPGLAKKVGRRVTLRPDWEDVKVLVMYTVVKAKFSQHPDLRDLLLATGGESGMEPLREVNDWGDETWGMVRRQGPNGFQLYGKNLLGHVLMLVRAELRP